MRLEIAIVDVVLVIVGASMALGAARAGVDVRPDTSGPASARGGAIRFGGIAAAADPGWRGAGRDAAVLRRTRPSFGAGGAVCVTLTPA